MADFSVVDYILIEGDWLADLLSDCAAGRSRHIGVQYGDSRRASPLGSGNAVLANDNQQEFERFGHSHCGQWIPPTTYGGGGGGGTAGTWLGRGGGVGGTALDSVTHFPCVRADGALNKLPPSMNMFEMAGAGGNLYDNTVDEGALMALNCWNIADTGVSPVGGMVDDALRKAGSTAYKRTAVTSMLQSLIDCRNTVSFISYWAKFVGSGEAKFACRPRTTLFPLNYNTASTATGNLSLGLNAAFGAVAHEQAFTWGGATLLYPQMHYNSQSAANVCSLGGRPCSDNLVGLTWDSWAVGGTLAQELTEDWGDYGAIAQIFDHCIAIMDWGANDSAGDVTAQDFADDYEANILHIRAKHGWQIPILCTTPPWRTTLGGTPALLNSYPDAIREVVHGYRHQRVGFWNQRRYTDEMGWNANNAEVAVYMSDGVHYTLAGGRAVARARTMAIDRYMRSLPRGGGLFL